MTNPYLHELVFEAFEQNGLVRQRQDKTLAYVFTKAVNLASMEIKAKALASLIGEYEKPATPPRERELIDLVFLRLCGFKFGDILHPSGEGRRQDPEEREAGGAGDGRFGEVKRTR